MTTSSITPLKPAVRRVAQHLVDGLAPQDIAAATCLAPATIRQYLRQLRASLGCPHRCRPPVIVHFLFASRQATPPRATRPAPELAPQEHRLLKAVAMHSRPDDIAAAAGSTPAYLPGALSALLGKTGAKDATQLIVLAYGWELMTDERSRTTEAGAGAGAGQ
ncbi:DNA-binding protein [Streptomyces ziwulingensis]|uniref:DNA-binding protein n=1 Tax=Streptomyces ziwulingensis TaxID=1045501 RepID=A0ABP9AJK0_9ACTN